MRLCYNKETNLDFGGAMKTKKIRSSMLLNYSIVLVVTFTVFFSVIFGVGIKRLDYNRLNLLKSDMKVIVNEIDAQLKTRDDLILRLNFSEPLKELIYDDIYNNSSESYFKKQQVSEYFFPILGPQLNNDQINIFNLNGNFIKYRGATTYLKYEEDAIKKISWINEVVKNDGKRFFTGLHTDPLTESDEEYCSIARNISKRFGGQKDTIIEIRITKSLFDSFVENTFGDNSDYVEYPIHIVDSKNELVYQNESFSSNKASITKLLNKTELNDREDFNNVIENKNWLVIYRTSSYSGIKVALIYPKSKVREEIFSFSLIIMLLIFLITVVLLLITNYIAKKISKPIEKLSDAVNRIDYNCLDNSMIFKEGFNYDSYKEIEDMSLFIEDMLSRIKKSVDDVVAAKTNEVESRLLALQSQLSPHFIFNIINTISVLAEEDNPTIVNICNDLSNVLRYISSDDDKLASLEVELEHVKSYVDLMRIRYPDLIEFHLETSKRYNKLLIPKLSIQPLVENSIKQLYLIDRVLKVHLKFIVTDSYLNIHVEDNGKGFSDDDLEVQKNLIDEILNNQQEVKTRIGGMGIANIAMRLYLVYGDKVSISINNNSEGGASIILRVPLELDKDRLIEL